MLSIPMKIYVVYAFFFVRFAIFLALSRACICVVQSKLYQTDDRSWTRIRVRSLRLTINKNAK